jgi:sulfoxide reductase catalytic subunit YedY
VEAPNNKKTSLRDYQNRRHFIKGAIALGMLPSEIFASPASNVCTNNVHGIWTPEQVTPFKYTSNYNNYYEFTSNKKMVRHVAKDFEYNNWQLSIDGLVNNPLTLDQKAISDIPQCERIYKLRCVEGWSAVIPWQGFELNQLIEAARPQKSAKYVVFTSLYDPKQMPGQRSNILPWPYTEALRLDEAMHSLTILANGMYSKPLPNQNGAPLRLVVPWKYGYKSIKSIVRITLVDKQPISSWSQVAPSEYGFYANVNPNIAHPRWSQRRELPLGETKKIRTKMFNGYFEQVKSLYEFDAIDTLF